MGIFKNLFGEKKKTLAELKEDVLRKATDNWNANSDLPDRQVKVTKKSIPVDDDINQEKNKNIRTILLVLAKRGEIGILPRSISDQTGVKMHDTSNILTYLTKKNYAELVNSPNGIKFYITEVGKKYCLSKEFNPVHK